VRKAKITAGTTIAQTISPTLRLDFAVVMATGGTSPGSRTVYLTSQNIIKSIRQKRIAAHESIYDDKWWASLRHGGDDSMLAIF
jgi:hypothetical protein